MISKFAQIQHETIMWNQSQITDLYPILELNLSSLSQHACAHLMLDGMQKSMHNYYKVYLYVAFTYTTKIYWIHFLI